MGANLQNVKFPFGFLNNTQDSPDLANDEAVLLNSLDPDKLALGTLESSALTTPALANPVFTTAILNGRNFQLTTGVLEYEEDSVTPAGVFQDVNKGDTTTVGAPPRGTIPVVNLTEALNPSSVTGTIVYLGAQMLSFQLNPSYTGPLEATYIVTVSQAAPLEVDTFRQIGSDTPVPQRSSVSVPDADFINMQDDPGNPDGVQFSIDQNYLLEPPVIGHSSQFSLDSEQPSDGAYSYLMVNVAKTGISPAQEVQGLPSEQFTRQLDNFNELGEEISTLQPIITFITPPSNTDEIWCYRQGPSDDSYVRIARYDGTNIFLDRGPDLGATTQFTDDGNTANIINLKLLSSAKDESFQDLNVAVGNPAGAYDYLFEKDGRLWMRPDERKDLLLYSRANEWWGWTRANTFGFQSDITNIAQVRDPTTVGGQFTTVVTTEKGIFHIIGNGTEESPYQLIHAVPDVNVTEFSLVDMNGVLMLMTKPLAGFADGYDSGPYGQKIYEYDLQKLTEVSARIKNSAILTDFDDVANPVTGATMRGSDKYIIKKDNIDTHLCYHRDAKGWVELDSTDEGAGDWTWQSKNFTPEILQRFKISNARFFKIDYTGTITITFTVQGALATDTSVSTFSLVAGARTEEIHRLPALKGRKWQVKLVGATASLFDFYLVR